MDDVLPHTGNNKGIIPKKDTPLNTHSIDKGSSTLERWDYQYGYTAKLIIEMFAKSNDHVSIYPEYHDDILVYCKDGRFEAYQVKTRSENYEGFRFNDSEITETLQRFVNFEIKFPNQFRKYHIITNNGFSPRKEYSIHHVLEQVKNSKETIEPKKMNDVIIQISEKCKTNRLTVINVLKNYNLKIFRFREL